MQGTISSDLILKAQHGDAAAIGAIYRSFHLGIYRYLFYRVADHQTAEDLTSEVFIRMIKSLPKYQVRGIPFQAWLYRIARNLVIDHSRRNGKYRQVLIQENLVANTPDPEAEAERSIESAMLKRALTRLNKEQQDVVLLRFVVCLPIADTALVLKKSHNAVKGLQRRGLANLREQLSVLEVRNA